MSGSGLNALTITLIVILVVGFAWVICKHWVHKHMKRGCAAVGLAPAAEAPMDAAAPPPMSDMDAGVGMDMGPGATMGVDMAGGAADVAYFSETPAIQSHMHQYS